MKIKQLVKSIPALALALPFAAQAQTDAGLDRLSEFVVSIGAFIEKLIPIFFALILLAFFYGLMMYLFALARGQEGAQDRGKGIMIGGVIALFVGASVFALVLFVQQIFGIEGGVTISLPRVDVEENVGGSSGSTDTAL